MKRTPFVLSMTDCSGNPVGDGDCVLLVVWEAVADNVGVLLGVRVSDGVLEGVVDCDGVTLGVTLD